MKKVKEILASVWTKFKNWPLWVKIVAGVVLLVLLIGLKGCFLGKKPAPAFKFAKVERGNITDIVEASGPINPVNTTQVGALVSGEILKLYVDYNSEVKKGHWQKRVPV